MLLNVRDLDLHIQSIIILKIRKFGKEMFNDHTVLFHSVFSSHNQF